MTKEYITEEFKRIQDYICQQLEQADGKALFQEDLWQREEGGGGRSRVLKEGNIIEKGGVGFSAVHGNTPEKILSALALPPSDFFATGVSIVLHPNNPHVPIIHMNIRYFEMSNGTYWFGGGIDLTPHYIVKEDAQFFHATLKAHCDSFHPDFYTTFKNWADDYFYIPHRKETRGIGGIFFDHLNESKYGLSKEQAFAFVKATGMLFTELYVPLMKKNHTLPFSSIEKQWQKIRRGRYVEFNLVNDKGTKFGLDTNGRTESILMSLPPEASWEYDFKTQAGSKE
ncbi:MAG: oxygen-dependent coproporphyrinogen oxidase, partial [Cytophagaceae bacterium]|nr:oxygen-dependent coproporphyrinogen oxidase [Cytophagaceae bacterium]